MSRGDGGAGAAAGGGGTPPLHACTYVGFSMGGSSILDLGHVAPQAIRCAALVVPGSLHPGGCCCLFLGLNVGEAV